jgi:CRISPR-associated protein Csd1
MGLFQNLLETYELSENAIGIAGSVKDGVIDEKKTLLPIFHTTFKSTICVNLAQHGKFLSATRDKKEITIIIPCTEGSSGRTTNVEAHPLCDQLDYLGGINKAKTKKYLSELKNWKGQNPSLNAIHTYISGQTIVEDLEGSAIFKDNEYQEQTDTPLHNRLDYEKIRKLGVRFTVQTGDGFINVWESEELRDSWKEYVLGSKSFTKSLFDYISGLDVGKIATQHPKNINSTTGNAKLLSCNDKTEFTFRGRFAKQDDAIIIDYENSQKVHQMLRWLISNYGYNVDSQVIVAWAVDDNKEVKEKLYDNSYILFEDTQADIQTEGERLEELKGQVYADYAVKLRSVLQGYRNANVLKQHARKICIAAFDSATTGRMGLVFYQELSEDEYLGKIVQWHEDTSYFQTAWKEPTDDTVELKSSRVEYIGAPSYDEIIFAVYGKDRGDKSYTTLKKKTRKQLLECMFGNFAFPKNLVEMAANRASHPMGFMDKNGKFSENDWRKSVNISCALIRKYYKKETEEIPLELEKERTDRDYLFGRLLAVADKLERTALYKAEKQDTRTTNALKLMSAFQVKPYSTWGQLYNQLIPYRNQLFGAGYYQSLIDEIMVLFKSGDFESNTPLSPLYLLGYSAQNRALLKKDKTKQSEETNDGDITE